MDFHQLWGKLVALVGWFHSMGGQCISLSMFATFIYLLKVSRHHRSMSMGWYFSFLNKNLSLMSNNNKVAVPSDVQRWARSLERHSSALNPVRPFSFSSTAQWPSLDLGWSGCHLFSVSTVPSAQRHMELICLSLKPTKIRSPFNPKDRSRISRDWLLIDYSYYILSAELWVPDIRYSMTYS